MQSLARILRLRSLPSAGHQIHSLFHPCPSKSAASRHRLPAPRVWPPPPHPTSPTRAPPAHAHPSVRLRASRQSPAQLPAHQIHVTVLKSVLAAPPPLCSQSLCQRQPAPRLAHLPTFEFLRPPSTESPTAPPRAGSFPGKSVAGPATPQYPPRPVRPRLPRYTAPQAPPDRPHHAAQQNSRLSPRARRPHRGRE